METRQQFEGKFSAVVQERLKKSAQPMEEAIFMIDVFMAAGFFLAGTVERNSTTERQINCLFTRAQRVREEIERNKRSELKRGANGRPDGGIDGNPIIIPP